MATTVPKVSHLIGTNKVVKLEDVYANIGEICGVTKVDGNLPVDYDSYKSPILLHSSGVLRRAKVLLANNKIKTIYMVAANAPKINALVGLEYVSGLAIKSAWFPLHKTYG